MKIGCVASHKNSKSTEFIRLISDQYKEIEIYDDLISIKDSDCNILVAVGGDGFVLRVLHKIFQYKKNKQISVYGLNRGTLGFLLNNFSSQDENLIEKINQASKVSLSPLKITMEDGSHKIHTIYAINEISLIRQTYQAVNIKVIINGETKIESLIGDGVMLSTEAGSTAYNLSAGGVIIPLGSNLLTITAINPFRPRGWHRAIINDDAIVEFEIQEDKKRPVLACADFHQFYFIKKVRAEIDKDFQYSLLFNEDTHLSTKIMNEQFLHAKL
jgi:NAD+ kinase